LSTNLTLAKPAEKSPIESITDFKEKINAVSLELENIAQNNIPLEPRSVNRDGNKYDNQFYNSSFIYYRSCSSKLWFIMVSLTCDNTKS
jgi:hypothetical protein